MREGAGLLMIGGYLSFAGIVGKARYYATPAETALPVTISAHDDRAERSEDVWLSVSGPGTWHRTGVPDHWPTLLGYNQLTAKPEAEVLVDCGDDPLLAAGRHGAGRSAAFVSDCAPH